MAERRWAIALVTAFVLLTVLVALGALDGADRTLKQVFRPDMVWGPWQVRAQRTESALAPRSVLVVVAAVALAAGLWRRSWRPPVVAVLGLGAAGALGLLVKLALRRPDPNLEVTGAGSYPSGHTLTLVAGVGLVLLLSVGLNRWTWPLVALSGVLMGLCLVTEGAHWSSDVVGGGLLGAVVLAVLQGAPIAHLRSRHASNGGTRAPASQVRSGRTRGTHRRDART